MPEMKNNKKFNKSNLDNNTKVEKRDIPKAMEINKIQLPTKLLSVSGFGKVVIILLKV